MSHRTIYDNNKRYTLNELRYTTYPPHQFAMYWRYVRLWGIKMAHWKQSAVNHLFLVIYDECQKTHICLCSFWSTDYKEFPAKNAKNRVNISCNNTTIDRPRAPLCMALIYFTRQSLCSNGGEIRWLNLGWCWLASWMIDCPTEYVYHMWNIW